MTASQNSLPGRRFGVLLATATMSLVGLGLAPAASAAATSGSSQGVHQAAGQQHGFAKKKHKKCKKKNKKNCKKVKSVAKPATPAATLYNFYASGYGTTITSPTVGLNSGPTSYSLIGCTRRVGLVSTNHLVGADLNDEAQVGTVTTRQRTYRNTGGATVSDSTTTVAGVDLGSPTFGLTITGLQGYSYAQASKAGVFSAGSSFTFADIAPRGATALPAALDQAPAAILHQLATSGPIVIPGLGEIALNGGLRAVTSTYARAYSAGLRVTLYGADQLPGTDDDSDVILVSDYALIGKEATQGVFQGAAWGVDATVAEGLASVGRQPYLTMPCQGTRGVVQSTALVDVNPAQLNAIEIDGVRSSTYGLQGSPVHGTTGWDQSTVAGVTLGTLHIGAIRGVARVTMGADGRVTSSATQSIGSITVDGEAQELPTIGHPVTIPGVATLEVPAPVRAANGIRVTALRLTLLGGSAAQSVVNLGNAAIYTNR